jgi:hypothetical protein
MRVVELYDEGMVHPLNPLAGGVDLLVGRLVLLALHDGVLPVGRFDVELADVIARRELLVLCHSITWWVPNADKHIAESKACAVTVGIAWQVDPSASTTSNGYAARGTRHR